MKDVCGECGSRLEYAGSDKTGDWGKCSDPSAHGSQSTLYHMEPLD